MSIIARREREKLARRKTILAAARDLFFEKGYQATTMEEIAEKAELSKRTIYLYYKNKDDLYISVTIEGFLMLEEQMIKIIERKLPLEKKIKDLYFTVIDHCIKHPEHFRIFEYFFTDQARKSIPEELVDTIYEHTWKCLDYMKDVISEGVDRGIFRKDLNPVNLSILLWRTGAGILDLAVMGDQSKEELESYKKLFEENVDLLIRGAKTQLESASGKKAERGVASHAKKEKGESTPK